MEVWKGQSAFGHKKRKHWVLTALSNPYNWYWMHFICEAKKLKIEPESLQFHSTIKSEDWTYRPHICGKTKRISLATTIKKRIDVFKSMMKRSEIVERMLNQKLTSDYEFWNVSNRLVMIKLFSRFKGYATFEFLFSITQSSYTLCAPSFEGSCRWKLKYHRGEWSCQPFWNG